MKRTGLIFTLLVLFTITELYSQTIFEKGMYIDNTGKEIDGFIRNLDWLNEPKQIQFKTGENEDYHTLSIDDIQYFEVGSFRFKRYTIPFDVSYTEKSVPGIGRDPVYKERTAFLQLLVSGKASLYKLGSQNRFYFTIGNDSIRHLICKRYEVDGKIHNNESYKSQLFYELKCEVIKAKDIQDLSCESDDLIDIFKGYNDCVGESHFVYSKSKRKQIFHFYIKPGLRYAQIKTTNSQNRIFDINYDWKTSFSGALEFEYVMPFNKNKWSAFSEIAYQSYKSEVKNNNFNSTSDYFVSVADYKSIELNLGIRYYMYLSEKSAIYVNPKLTIIDFPINSKIDFADVNSLINIYIGAGYQYHRKYGIAFGISSNRSMLVNYAFYRGIYHYFNMQLSYRIF